MKRGAFVVERQRVTRAHDPWAQLAIGQFERPNVTADAVGHFVDRKAVGGDRVPQTEKADVLHARTYVGRGVRAGQFVSQPETRRPEVSGTVSRALSWS